MSRMTDAEKYLRDELLGYLKRLHNELANEPTYRSDLVYMIAEKIIDDRHQWANPTCNLKIKTNQEGCKIIKFPKKRA